MPDVSQNSDDTSTIVPAVPDYDLAPTVRADTPTQLKALAHPIRNAILHLVVERAATTGELAQAIGRPHGTIAHHLKVLEDAGLMRVVRTRKVRALTERSWGRTGRTILIDTIDPITHESSFLNEAAATMQAGEHGFTTLRYARIDDDRVEEWAARLDALTVEFAAQARSGSTVYGLLVALQPTDQPVLPDPPTPTAAKRPTTAAHKPKAKAKAMAKVATKDRLGG